MNSQSELVNEIFTALAKAQGQMSAASKDCKNPFFNSKYADLGSIWSACRDALSSNGICAIQTTHTKENNDVYLKTTLGHSSGQWIASEIKLDIPPPGATELDKYGKDKKVNIMQALGSILTYQKRYQLASIVGVAPSDDDDGNSSNYTPPTPESRNNTTVSNVEMITPFQVEQLKSELETCSSEFRQSVANWMKTNNIANYEALNKMNFLQLLQGAVSDNQRMKNQNKEVAQ